MLRWFFLVNMIWVDIRVHIRKWCIDFRGLVVKGWEQKTGLPPHSFPPDWILTEIDKYNKKIMIATKRYSDLFRVEN
jgi:hypothetical protein